MDNFALTGLIFVSVWILVAVKLTYDQMMLFKAYKEKIDASFPASPNDANSY